MENTKLAEKYLAKAERAFEHAANCTDEQSRMAWAAIAESFRDLASNHGGARGSIRARRPTGLLERLHNQTGDKRSEH